MSDTPELDLTAAVEAVAPHLLRLVSDSEDLVTDSEYPDIYEADYARAAIEAALPYLLAQISEGIAVGIEADAKHFTAVLLKVAPPADDWHRGYLEGCARGKERASIIARDRGQVARP